jgi:hypothetical protein
MYSQKIYTKEIPNESLGLCYEGNGYSIKKTAKGISTSVNKRENKHDIYKDSLLNEKIVSNKQKLFKSILHNITTIEVNKVGLSPFDDKRYEIDNYNTLAFGHYKINEN